MAVTQYKNEHGSKISVGEGTPVHSAVNGDEYKNLTNGDKYLYQGGSWIKLTVGLTLSSTTDLAEGTNLYFTEGRVRSTPLTGLTVTGSTVVSTDTVLEAMGKLQNQVNAVASPMIYQGVWNASTNSPALVSSIGTKGHVYRVSTTGTTNIDGITTWTAGDFIVFNGTTWDKWDATDAITSVNGYTGVVTLVKADLGLASVENTALSTWAGTSNITTLGTVATGVWNGTAIGDSYISSAATWNAKISGAGGSANYVPRFIGSGSVIGNSSIQDDGTTLSIGTSLAGNARLNIYSNVTYGISTTTDAANGRALYGASSGNGSLTTGVYGISTGTATINAGLYGAAVAPAAKKGVGVYSVVTGTGTKYCFVGQDGTQVAGAFLKSITSDGEANWASLASLDITTALGYTPLNKAGDTMTGTLTVGASFILTGTVNSSLTGANTRIPSHTNCNVTFTNASLTSIGSANNGGVVDGHTLFLTNATGSSITIINNYGSAAAGEAIFTGTGTNVTIPDKGSFWLRWNTTTNSWLCSSSGVFNIQDSQLASTFIKADGTVALTADWSAGATRRITSGYLTSTNDASIAGMTVGLGGGAITTNVALGISALAANTTGARNVAIGNNALASQSSAGSYNVAIGFHALSLNTDGGSSVAIGDTALRNNTTGTVNVAVGGTSLNANTTGSSNTAMGYWALKSNTTASFNTAIGSYALQANVTGTQNLAVGYRALYYNTANSNLAVGNDALYSNTTGTQNVGIGVNSGFGITSGSNNVGLGVNTLLGVTTGNNNIGIGSNSTRSVTTGASNIGIGSSAGYTNITGVSNVALGVNSLYSNSAGDYNTAIGTNALYTTTASNTVAIGYDAMFLNLTGTSNTAIGVSALRTNSTGADNTAIGNQALYLSTGSNNTAIGLQALSNNTTGADNVALGHQAGKFLADGSTANATSGTSIFIGGATKANAATGANEIVIGYGVIGGGSNTTTIGLVGTTTQTHVAGSLKINNVYTLPNVDGTANQVLKTNGSGTVSWSTVAGTGDALVANPLSQFAATTSAQLAGVISDETGSGALVFAVSPALTGTPTAPTAATTTNTTQIATTAFVQQEIAAGGGGGADLGLIMAIQAGNFYL